MPTALEKELVTLAHRLADLCTLTASAFEEASRALLENGHTLGEQAAAAAALGAACEDQACALLALHAPHEADVKAVVAAVHTAADLTRMGGLAAELAGRVPPDARPAFARLGAHAVTTARELRRILVEPGAESGLDDAVADVEAAERELRAWAGGRDRLGAAVDVVLLAAVHGRFAATAAGIARRVRACAPVKA